MNQELTARRGVDTPAVATITSDVETLMRGMRHEISLDEIISQSTTQGDADTIAHFMNAISPGSQVVKEVAQLIERDKARK